MNREMERAMEESCRQGWIGGRPWRLLAVAAIGALAAMACGGTSGGTTTQAATGSPIKVGVLDDQASSLAVEGAELRVNTDLAIAQINASGGVHGHPLQAVYVDPNAQPDEALNLAQQLVQQQNVDLMVGAILSSECLGVENLAARLQVVYMASTGCASEDFTAKQCNKYSFRVSPSGRQGIIPLSTYIVNQYGKKWAVIYSDYAFGQSQANAYNVGLTAAGGELTNKIPIPLNETNVTPYITKVPTDGSINGLINAQVGADLVRSSQVITQFGLTKQMPVVGVFGKERFAGVYPDYLTGDLGQAPELSDSPSDNKFDIAYHAAFRAQLAKEPSSVSGALGGDKAVPGGLGYQAYTTMTALKLAMLQANFSGKQDTAKLITALENLKASQSADFPGGAFSMNKADHQGVQTTYVAKISGQSEQVLKTIPPDQLPPIGSCQVK
jgi:branched-chain amino acid transport system substrate-binding protein